MGSDCRPVSVVSYRSGDVAMKKSEHAIQNEIRNALAGRCKLFRANVGKAYASNDIVKVPRQMPVVMGPKDILLRNYRPFDTGLPPGFTDTFGYVVETITPEMVGQKIARFIGPEIKSATGKPSPLQAVFISVVNADGGRAGVVRSVEDAERLVFGGDHVEP